MSHAAAFLLPGVVSTLTGHCWLARTSLPLSSPWLCLTHLPSPPSWPSSQPQERLSRQVSQESLLRQLSRGMDLTLSAERMISRPSEKSGWVGSTMRRLSTGTVWLKICISSSTKEVSMLGWSELTTALMTFPLFVPMKRTSKLWPFLPRTPLWAAILVRSSPSPNLTNMGLLGWLTTGWSIRQLFLMKWRLGSGRLELWL